MDTVHSPNQPGPAVVKPQPGLDPLQSFQALLQRRGYAADAIARRLQLASRILRAIDPADTSNQGYRQAVDRVVSSLPDPASAARCQQVAREFFPCFVEAGRRVPVTQEAVPVRPEEIAVFLPPHEGLDDLIRQAQAMKTTQAEKRALEAFDTFLKSQGLNREARARRLAIGRMLLLGMRPLKAEGRYYRALIERLLTLFTRDETRSYFLGVARDFYPYVIASSGDP
ncbi:MAG: hypothetical protein ACUVSD_05485 [Thiobacillaceae bacterium]